jgi:3-methyladenine DNA glycosylase AlkD
MNKNEKNKAISSLSNKIKSLAEPKKAQILQRFFKTGPGEYGEGDKFLGITVPKIRLMAEECKNLETKELAGLIKSPWHEERLCALIILTLQFKTADEITRKKIFSFYLMNTKYINNWDLVDLTADKIVGAYLNGKDKSILFKLVKSKDLWERRIAMLSSFHYIKNGRADEAIKIAEALLHDKQDLIHKAVGWMLREIGKRCSEKILYDFLDKYYHEMPRTMLRYAIERLPEKRRKYYLKK